MGRDVVKSQWIDYNDTSTARKNFYDLCINNSNRAAEAIFIIAIRYTCIRYIFDNTFVNTSVIYMSKSSGIMFSMGQEPEIWKLSINYIELDNKIYLDSSTGIHKEFTVSE